MNESPHHLAKILSTLDPVLHDGVFVFTLLPPGVDVPSVETVATFREAEGTTLITTEAEALRAKLAVVFRAAWITLRVNSELSAVGLTAAFSKVLGEAGISCNVVAAALHDHIFVPVERGQEGLAILKKLQHDVSR